MKPKNLLARKRADLRVAAARLREREPMFRVLHAIEAAGLGVRVECWDWSGDGAVMLDVDRFGEVAPALGALRRIIGRRPDSLPRVDATSLERSWSWRLPCGRLTLTATLTGKICRLEKVGEEIVHHPAHDEKRPIMRLVCPPEEVQS